MGQKARSWGRQIISGLPRPADLLAARPFSAFVPEADVSALANVR
jgi:hypothetical protein